MKMQSVIFRTFSSLFFILYLTACFFCFSTRLHADSRQGNLDVFLLLDRSLSMEQEFFSLQQYVEHNLFDSMLQNGDFLTVIAFYGETQDLTSGVIGSDVRISDQKLILSSLKPDRHYTDIGSALDALAVKIRANSRPGYPDYILMLTDGYHEGPPGSPYPGKTYTLSHPFLKLQKQIELNGWKSYLLGITVEDMAGDLADEVITAWQARN